jgi:hypothetical protein
MAAIDETAAAFAKTLRDTYRVKGILAQMAERGQLLELRCEMPKCYDFKGRRHFDPVGHAPDSWIPTADHYPVLRSRGGKLEASNVRLGHKLCNNLDFAWRSRITAMLARGMSLAAIADELERKKIPRPHGSPTWTPGLVREAFVS